jgi:alginate O-acetyltransferase complex protein AlgI
MLFNSYTFIFVFLPVVCLGFYAIGYWRYYRLALAWLVGASLYFYGWWDPIYLGLMVFSVIFNYLTGWGLVKVEQKKIRRGLVILGVTTNLSLLGYFKYTTFFVETLNALRGSTYHIEHIILPLAISFFTFQQIAYLIDAYKGKTQETNFLQYCLFVTFFPQLIAGPIVHHHDMLPQFAKPDAFRFNHDHIARGWTIFIIGLFKKVVLADGVAGYANIVFDAAENQAQITFFEGWVGALSYTFQLYFDFSGYSDMAIGIAMMFGIYLPLNFASPYKAVNMIDFWRRWHMTLSRFLRDYLYIPLGGSRKGAFRRYLNLIITMVLGGLWHGAGWTFVLWGALHGFYLSINHLWQSIRRSSGHDLQRTTRSGRVISRLLTFMAVVLAWVFFRAESLDGAFHVLQGMIGMNDFILPRIMGYYFNQVMGYDLSTGLVGIGIPLKLTPRFGGIDALRDLLILFIIAFFAPNTQQIMRKYISAHEALMGKITPWTFPNIQWQPNKISAFIISIGFIYVVLKMTDVSEFLYFQF